MLDDLAREIYDRMQSERRARVLAIWRDGSLSLQGLGFRHRKRPDGTSEEPVATFVTGSDMSYYEVRRRLEEGLVRRGLLPPA